MVTYPWQKTPQCIPHVPTHSQRGSRHQNRLDRRVFPWRVQSFPWKASPAPGAARWQWCSFGSRRRLAAPLCCGDKWHASKRKWHHSTMCACRETKKRRQSDITKTAEIRSFIEKRSLLVVYCMTSKKLPKMLKSKEIPNFSIKWDAFEIWVFIPVTLCFSFFETEIWAAG